MVDDEQKTRSRPNQLQVISGLDYWHATAPADDLEDPNTEQFWLHRGLKPETFQTWILSFRIIAELKVSEGQSGLDGCQVPDAPDDHHG